MSRYDRVCATHGLLEADTVCPCEEAAYEEDDMIRELAADVASRTLLALRKVLEHARLYDSMAAIDNAVDCLETEVSNPPT